MNKEKFIDELKKINIDITSMALDKLEKYYNILIEENKKINLTRIIEKEDVYLKHFYDSLTLNKIIDLNNKNLCDIGSGAGFPGIVLKIVFPNLSVTLIDSSEKRCRFLNLVIDKLELKNIKVVNNRAENYSMQVREEFDIVTARAVSNIKELLEISFPLVKVNGYFIAMKSNIENEIKNIDNCLKELNCCIEEIKEFTLPIEKSMRNLIKVKKSKTTNKKYPRNYSAIKNKPL